MVVLLHRRAARYGHWCTKDGASATFSTPGNVLSSRDLLLAVTALGRPHRRTRTRPHAQPIPCGHQASRPSRGGAGLLVAAGTGGITQRTRRWSGRRREGGPAEHVDVLVGERGEPGRVGVVNIAGGAQLAERGVGVAGVPQHDCVEDQAERAETQRRPAKPSPSGFAGPSPRLGSRGIHPTEYLYVKLPCPSVSTSY